MEMIHTYDRLKVVCPEKKIFFRLGGNLHLTGMSNADKQHYYRLILKAYSLCVPQGRWKIKQVAKVAENGIYFSDGTFLAGSRFATSAADAAFIWFAASTTGLSVVEARDALSDISEAVIYDAVASEMADSTMDMVQKMAAAELIRHGILLDKKRYSPGYGDMPLEVQKFMFSQLEMIEMNLVLTDNCFIVPEKSVTALAAVMKQKQQRCNI